MPLVTEITVIFPQNILFIQETRPLRFLVIQQIATSLSLSSLRSPRLCGQILYSAQNVIGGMKIILFPQYDLHTQPGPSIYKTKSLLHEKWSIRIILLKPNPKNTSKRHITSPCLALRRFSLLWHQACFINYPITRPKTCFWVNRNYRQRIGEKQWQKEMWIERIGSRTNSGSRSNHCFRRSFPNPEVVVHGWMTGGPWKPYYMYSAPAANGRRCHAAWVLRVQYTTAFRSGEEPACLSACGKPGFWNTLN